MKEIIYERIYSDLLEKIKNGTYQPGDRIPTEMQIASDYHVSRITSKKALEMLADQKLIERTPGRGSFVSDQTKSLLENAQDTATFSTERTVIGVILDNFGMDFGSSLLKSIENECRKRKYTMILYCTHGSLAEENRVIEDAVSLGAKGLIIMCAQDETYNPTILKLNLKKYPIVLIDRQMQGIAIPCVKTDNEEAAKELTKMLIDRGNRRLCFLSHSSLGTSTIKERYEGFVSAIMEQSGVTGKMIKVPGYNPSARSREEKDISFDYRELKKQIVDEKESTAILCVEYQLASYLGEVLRMLHVNKEIAVFDGMPESCRDFGVGFIKQDENLMGIKTVELLEQLMQKETLEENIIIPHKLIRNLSQSDYHLQKFDN